MLRRLSSFLAATAVAVGVLAITAPAAHASTEESQFTQLANQERAKRGLRAYSVASDLVAVARRHAQKMAASGTIYHNPNLGSDVSGWQAVGENVGMGGSASSIHSAFMNSTAHRDNILDRDFTQVGMGTAKDSKGVLYVTQVFRKPSGSAPAPAPAPKPTYSPAPKPAYRPVATTAPKPAYTAPAAKPAAKKPAVKKADPKAVLAERLADARRVAAKSAPGVLGRAVTFVDVMAELSA